MIVLDVLNISIGWKVLKVCTGFERLMSIHARKGKAFLKSPVKLSFYYGFDNCNRFQRSRKTTYSTRIMLFFVYGACCNPLLFLLFFLPSGFCVPRLQGETVS